MNRLTKKLWVFVMLLSLALSANTIVFAATYHSTGLEDGLYEASTAANPDLMNTYYKLSAVVEGGKVSTGSFELRVDGYPSAITISFADYAPDQTAKDFINNTCPEVEDYASQFTSTGDGALVVKSSKAVEGSTIYDIFNKLWKDVVKQAGGEVVADGADTDTVPTTNVPKTGVVSFGAIFGIGAIASATGLALIKKNKLKRLHND